MALASGTRIGPYEIVAPIGAGGMGEVYRAHDTKLGRDVAIKILPELFTTDAERLARFDREARVLASLNHPNIAAIYGLEDAQDHPALVLELVEGETLAEKVQGLRAEGVGLDEAIAIARQIVEALDAAHDKGVIHRDLKPANIKLKPDGVVKVLDFGLAKLQAPEAGEAGRAGGAGKVDPSMSPTLMTAATNAGVILGTAAYMSPEQARGKTVDKRSDIWAFGCVLYELLTGTRPFGGNEVSDTLALILTKDPDWSALPANTPASIRRLLRRCLEKDRGLRLADVADARIELRDATAGEPSTLTSTTRPPSRDRLAWTLAAVAGVAAVALAVPATFFLRRPAVDAAVTRLEMVTPPTTDPISFALSPDGRQLAFVATAEGVPRLWVRALDQTAARALSGTDNAVSPFWAPDGKAIGFFADGKLKRLDLAGGASLALADAPGARGGTWSRDGVILFAPQTTSGLMRVPASGGAPSAVTRLAPGQGSHRWPQFLPDGHRFLFFVALGTPEAQGVYVGSLDGGAPTRVMAAEAAAVFAPPGWLFTVRQGVLNAWRFDPSRGLVTQDPVPVAQGVGIDSGLFLSASTVSASNVLAHRAGITGRRQLVWVDRAGAVRGTVGPPDDNALTMPGLALDGRHVAVRRSVQGNLDVWLLDVTRGVPSRFTFDASIDNAPVWSPDSQRVVFASTRRGGVYDLFEKAASGAGDEQPLLSTSEAKLPLSWSTDGRFLLYTSQNPQTGSDLWALPMVGERKPFPIVQTRFEEVAGQFSPDGRWVAFQSNENGRSEVYVRPFPQPGGQWQVSAAGGVWPRWRRDGKELFYVAPDNRLMAVPLAFGPDHQTVEAGAPVTLFATRLASGAGVTTTGYVARAQYDVAADGRFLMNVNADDAGAPPITIVLNWEAGLKKDK